MLFAFVIGLLDLELRDRPAQLGRASSPARPASDSTSSIGAVAGLFSLFVGTIFLFGLNDALPDLGAILPF